MNLRATMIVLVLATAAFASESQSLKLQAENAYTSSRWADAAKLYKSLSQAEPQTGMYWLRLGNSLRQLGEYKEAEAAFDKASELKFAPGMVTASRASLYAAMNDADRATAAVQQLVKMQFPGYKGLQQDPAVANLRDAKFVAALNELKAVSMPCSVADRHPEYRQFDFWIGDWDVYNPQGVLAGRNDVRLILSDCVIAENWTSRVAGEGKSFNKYNAAKKRWEQYWVDDQGQTTFFWGNLEGQNMVFHSDGENPDGSKFERRLTFFPLAPNKVRQFSQLTSDGGKTWTTEYDLTYIRRDAKQSAARTKKQTSGVL